jgi:membrane-bound lytic murein transglycosylase D
MKRFFTVAICLLSLQTVTARVLPVIDSPLRLARDAYPGKISKDTNFAAPLSSYSNSVYKLRLDSMQKDVPLDYNEYVQDYIDIYTRHKNEMAHVLGLSKYYFPIYEKIFREAGIPSEIKYLSIVESKLDPAAVSRVGATGPWQFMSTTAKMYGLNMDGYVDDRRDPIKSSYAAAAYLKAAYQEFGDWLLAIASYNCGKSNVEHAIEKAGAMDFWSIRPYLPVETRGYVPAYIAISYVMNYADKQNILAEMPAFSLKNDTIMVDRFISLGDVAKALNTDIGNLATLNPAYTHQVVNGTSAYLRKLIIPNTNDKNYSALYDVLNTVAVPVLLNAPTTVPGNAANADARPAKQPGFHTVKKGETLADIAADYGLDVHELKVWNHLKTSHVATGRKLRLSPVANDSDESSSPAKDDFLTYKVKRGDTLSDISEKFNASVESIKSLNGLKKDHLQPGMMLKISRG